MKAGELERLIVRCQNGDRQAWETLIPEVQVPVCRRCRTILGQEEDARDAAQDVLLALLEGLGSLREPEAFWGWLNRMCANISFKRLIRSQREIPFPEDSRGRSVLDVLEDPDILDLPDQFLDHNETRQTLAGLVEALPEPQRRCICMFYYDERPVREIAAIMGTSEGTVKSRLHYARKHLRQVLEPPALPEKHWESPLLRPASPAPPESRLRRAFPQDPAGPFAAQHSV